MDPVDAARPTIRVLNIAETIKGGVATYLAGLELGQDALGCEFAHLIPVAHTHELQAARIFTHRGSRSPLGLLRLAWRAIAVQRQYRAHIVFAHSTFAGIVLCLIRPLLGRRVRTIYCPHGWAMFRDMGARKKQVVQSIERVMSYLPSRVVNISRFEHASTCEHGFSSRCMLIPNAVADVQDHRVSDSCDSRPLRVLYVGRFDRQKGIDIFLGAIRRLNEEGQGRFAFDVVGGEVLGDESSLPIILPPNVTHHGWLSGGRVHERYKAADILVMPSRWEGFGLCAIEAFRAGTPVLARRVGALTDIVSNGNNGYLFEGGAEELAQALLGLDLGELRAMRKAARHTFETSYRIERLHRQYRNLFCELRYDSAP